ncbi:MAG: hypothetical protein AB8G96_04735 [Phycisphaerales bacterium]
MTFKTSLFVATAMASAAALASPALAADATVDFSSQAIGNAWGGPLGTPPGVTQFTEDAIDVSFGPMSSGAYNVATIDPPLPLFGTGQILRLNNLQSLFDLSALGCVEQVTLGYVDFGGSEELQVNGGPVFAGDIAAAPLNIAPGITATVTAMAIPGGKRGTITLDGNVQKFAIAGQEFWIDDICVTVCDGPPPPGPDCDQLMDFESVPVDTKWGVDVGTVPGDVQIAEDGIVAGFEPNTAGAFDLAVAVPAFNGMGDGIIICLQNIAMFVKTSDPATVGKVEFEYMDLGGTEELGVNGAPIFVGQIGAAPFNIAPGVTCTVSSIPVPGGTRGVVTLTGMISLLHIAGQEFYIDNICESEGNGPPPECDHLMDFESQALGTSWGAAFGTPVGVPQFSEDGLDAAFEATTGGFFNEARIIPSFAGLGSGRVLGLNNIAFFTKPGAVGLVERVEFVYADLGGTEELQVNGAPIFVGNMAGAPVAIAPGVSCSVMTTPIPGGVLGRVTLDGPVETLLIAGQEFAIDDICVTLADIPPCVGDVDMDGMVGFTDVVAVLAAFGPCPGCPADVTGDGTVSFDDLLAVLSAWGPC